MFNGSEPIRKYRRPLFFFFFFLILWVRKTETGPTSETSVHQWTWTPFPRVPPARTPVGRRYRNDRGYGQPDGLETMIGLAVTEPFRPRYAVVVLTEAMEFIRGTRRGPS